MKRLKILLLVFEFPPYPFAGTGMYAFNLANYLAKNHDVTIIMPNHPGSTKEVIDKNIKFIKIDSMTTSKAAKVNRSFIDKKTLFSLGARKLLKKINLKEYDIFHSLTERDGALLDYRYMNKFVKTIISVNDYYIVGAPWNPFKFYFTMDFPIRYIHHNIMKLFYFKALKNCNNIVPNTDFVKNVLADGGIDPSKMIVINRGVNLKRCLFDIDDKKYSSHKVLFIGPNAERKGAFYVVSSMPKVLEKFPDARLTIVGSSSFLYKRKIKNFVKKNNLSDKVEFFDQLPYEEVLNRHRDANVFVMPSLMEAFGQVYLEALATKTPAIGARVGGVPDIITPDVGFLVPPRNSDEIAKHIIELFSDPKKAKKMGEAGRIRVKKNFSIEKMVKETEDVYKSLI